MLHVLVAMYLIFSIVRNFKVRLFETVGRKPDAYSVSMAKLDVLFQKWC